MKELEISIIILAGMCIVFFLSWLISHILKFDEYYKEFLKGDK